MKIVIAGGSGFLGVPLARTLVTAGHEVVILTRRDDPVPIGRAVRWNPDDAGGGLWKDEIANAGALVNLAGESIAARRWTAAQKRKIHQSRTVATRALVAAIERASPPPAAFVSGSAVGYYGALGDEVVLEDHAPGHDFLAGVCVDWEAEAAQATKFTRVVCVRTGLVLEKDGGALPKMLPPFRFGAGGPIGSGRQYWPWIHRDDWVRLVRWAIEKPAVSGPVNASAPEPVQNRVFASHLGRALHRPALLPTPAIALRLILGEMADGLLLSGQRAIPAKAQRLGFTFQFPELAGALQAIFH
jgi:uncharacterized protein (TIGR01777 family)